MDNKDKLIISLYDYTGNWVMDYINAGYTVILWDKEFEGDLIERFGWLMCRVDDLKEQNPRLIVYGIFAAPPCQAITKSSNRYWYNRYLEPFIGELEAFENLTVLSTMLVEIALHAVDVFKPKFWVLENPPGRMETLVPAIKPHRKMMFQPCDYGDPYSKPTVLWGEFNHNLPQSPVLPIMTNMIRDMGARKGKSRARLRSATPRGFAKAFFQANR
ncbi:MAG TPA: hypothetical protein VGK59_23835 [Ohtaekwangia sp.]